MSLASLFNAQHVLNASTSIIRSLRERERGGRERETRARAHTHTYITVRHVAAVFLNI